MIGKKITVQYYDQNLEMEKILPRSGTVTKIVKSNTSPANWYVIKLNQPFRYRAAVQKHDSNIGTPDSSDLQVKFLLISSRWEDCNLESGDETSVFVFLMEEDSTHKSKTFNLEKFYFACWGIVAADNPI